MYKSLKKLYIQYNLDNDINTSQIDIDKTIIISWF